MLEAGKAVELRDIRNDPRFPFKMAAVEAGWSAALGLPIRSQGRLCGVIEGLSFDPVISPWRSGHPPQARGPRRSDLPEHPARSRVATF